MKYPRRFGSSRAEPDIVLAIGDEAGAASSKGTLVRQGRRQVFRRKPFPIHSAVIGDNQLKLPVCRVAQGQAIPFIPKGNGIKEGFMVWVIELKDPSIAAISRFVD